MEFKQFFKWIENRWSDAPKTNELFIISLGLGGEAGEVQEVIKKCIRDDNYAGELSSKRELALIRELGDVLHYWCRVCQYFDLDPYDIMKENVDKLKERDIKRVKEGVEFTT